MKYTFLFILGFLLILLNLGCQTVNETHFIHSNGNYYRLKIKSSAFASKSRYLSGYYDVNAVDNYFSDISKRDSSQKYFQKLYNDTSKIYSSKNTKLVMLLSTNSSVIADQIGNLAQNEQTLEMMARLSNSAKIKENNELQEKNTEIYSQNKAIISVGDLYLKELNANDSSAILAYLNYISTIKKMNYNFKNINEAKNWLMYNK